MKKFSIRIFVMICLCVVLPFTALCHYIKNSMEHFLQEQISDKVLENISRDERNIYEELQKMAFFSNGLVCDEELQKRLWDERSSYYENSIYFRELLGKMFLNGQDKIVESAKVILFDTYGRCYSNWGLNFQDYLFLLEEEWVREANESGHIIWRMFDPAYIMEDAKEEQYISLVRAVLDEKTAGRRVGTLIMSINRGEFSDIMTRYAYEGDKVYVCINEAQVLMDNDVMQEIGDEEIRMLFDEVGAQRSGMLRRNVKDKEYLINYYTLRKPWEFDGQAIRIFHFTDYREIREQVEGITGRISAVIFLVLLFILLIAYMAAHFLVKPITLLTSEMNTYSIDKEIKAVDVHRRDEIGELNRAFCRMSDKLKEAFWKAQEDYKVREQYRYESLRAQLNPHFLFNTLTSIRWMAVIRGADNIVDSIDALAGLLKYSLGSMEELVTIREELEHISNYVSIQNYRYGEQLVLDIDIEEAVQDWKTMRFILQPIVENAVIHGYGSRDKKRHTIYIYGDREGDCLNLYVEDEGVGISQDQIEAFENGRKTASGRLTGIGLHHVDECIRMAFGEEYGLKLSKNAERGTIVQFILPVLENREDEGVADEKSDDRG